MSEELKKYLERALEQLNEAEKKIAVPGEWKKESAHLSALKELVKEQISNENSSHTTSSAR
ncbi:MAG: hypothetical protein AB7F59_00085 [Bdellovibrionales bacterium]